MKIFFFLFCTVVLTITLNAQEIVNVVLVGDDGVTEDIKKAHSFVIVKKYPGSFQRLDYKKNAPLQKLRTYTDSSLTVLQGDYYEYDANGNMSVRGEYENNAKEQEWYFYNDTGKIIRYEMYEKGVLVKTTNPDTLKKEKKADKISATDAEAAFDKKGKGWIKYLQENLRAEVSSQSVNGGTTVVEFVVDTEGHCINVHLYKSVEFILDEEAIRVIEKSPQWKQPAIVEGKKVKAYRRQPITFAKM